MNIDEFFSKYADEKNCRQFFKNQRDKTGIICKRCGGLNHYWKQDKWQYECKDCKFRTSLKSGTVMENSNLPLRYWLWAMFFITMSKKSFSSLEMQKQIRHKRYEPIWLMMHKLRIAMGNRDAQYELEGFIEIDEGFFEGHRLKEKSQAVTDKQPKELDRQVKVLVAVQSSPLSLTEQQKRKRHQPDRKAGYLKMFVIDSLSKKDVEYEVSKNITAAAQALTDGRRCYSGLKNIIANHQVIIGDKKKEVSKIFPWVHTAISNAKKVLSGIHHSVKQCYMQNYLNEFSYKFNRRYFGNKLFECLLVAALKRPCFSVRYDCG